VPRYEFRCRACGDTFLLTRPMSQSGDPATCPQGHDDTVKLLTTVGLGGRSSGSATRTACGGAQHVLDGQATALAAAAHVGGAEPVLGEEPPYRRTQRSGSACRRGARTGARRRCGCGMHHCGIARGRCGAGIA